MPITPTDDEIVRDIGADAVPADVLALRSVPRVDYVDRFTLALDPGLVDGVEGTPEQWARALFGDVPGPAQSLIWHRLMRLELQPLRSPAWIAGWYVAGGGPDWVRLHTGGPWYGADLVVQAEAGRVAVTTVLEYRARAARRSWPLLAPVHRALVPAVLRRGASLMRRRGRRPQ